MIFSDKNKGKKRLGNYPILSVLVSTSLALFVSGLLGILLLHAHKVSSSIKDNFKLFVYLDKDISIDSINQVKKKLSDQRYALNLNGKPKIEYISKDIAAKYFINDTKENFWDVLDQNPLRDTIILNIKHEYQDEFTLNQIKTKIEQIDNVYEVSYSENLVEYVNQNLKKVEILLWVFSIILVFSVGILINNTIKLAMYSQRFLIRSMQLVGAFPKFIKRPFIQRAYMTGITAGLLADIAILILLQYINLKSETIANLQNPVGVFAILFIILGFGVFIDVFCTYLSINKYLSMSLDELY